MNQYYYDPFAPQAAQYQNELWQQEYERQQRAAQEKHEIRMISLGMGLAIIGYLVIQSILSALLLRTGLYDAYRSNPVLEYGINIVFVSFAAVAVPFGVMALVNKSKYRYPLIPDKKLGGGQMALWIGFGMLCCIGAQLCVSYLVTALETLFHITLLQPEAAESDSVLALVLEFVGTAIVPAICEEFAMRCCSLQLLRRYGTGFAVFAVSIVFGLLHGNVIQFLFAFLVGATLGFVTVKTGSIVPAILIHGLNNAMSSIGSIATYYGSQDIADTVTAVMYVAWAIFGIAATVLLAVRGGFRKEKNAPATVLTGGQKMAAFLFPWMIVPFLALFAITAQYIRVG